MNKKINYIDFERKIKKEDEEDSVRMVICWKKRRKRSKTKQVVSRVFNAHDFQSTMNFIGYGLIQEIFMMVPLAINSIVVYLMTNAYHN
jgi:DNA gyrase/topoisomerase IV subunit A